MFCHISLLMHQFEMWLIPLERRQKLTWNRLWNCLIQLCYEGENWVTSFILIIRLWIFVGFGGFWKKVRIFTDLGERIYGESINLVIFLPLFEFIHNQRLNWKFNGDFIMDHVIGGKFKLGRKIRSDSFGELYLGFSSLFLFFLFLIHLFGYTVL